MQFMRSIIVSGMLLMAAFLLCLLSHSPAMIRATWLVCLVWGMVIFVTGFYCAISRTMDREEEKIRRSIELDI
jgi:uncharacterized membrane protein